MYMYNRWSIIYIRFIYIEHFFYITYYYGILGNGRGGTKMFARNILEQSINFVSSLMSVMMKVEAGYVAA